MDVRDGLIVSTRKLCACESGSSSEKGSMRWTMPDPVKARKKQRTSSTGGRQDRMAFDDNTLWAFTHLLVKGLEQSIALIRSVSVTRIK